MASAHPAEASTSIRFQPAPRAKVAPGPVVTAYAIRGATLLRIREAAGLSQRALSVRTAERGSRVSQANVERIEAAGEDVVMVNEETLRGLLAGLEVARDELFR